MARYSKTALYKLQNIVHAVKPNSLTPFERKIVEIPEAHVRVNPLDEHKLPESDLKDPFAPIETTQEPVKKKSVAKTRKKRSSKKMTTKKAVTKKAAVKTKSKKTAPKKSTNKKAKPTAKYSKKAGEKVEKTLHEMKRGTLKSGSGKKVKSRKQAIAIGLSEAGKKGAKVPKAPVKKSAKKKTTKNKYKPLN